MLRHRFIKRSMLLLTLLFAAASVQAFTVNNWRSDLEVDQRGDLTVTDEAGSLELLPSQSAIQPVLPGQSEQATGEFSAVPEPGTLLLLMCGLLGLSLSGGNRQHS